MSKKIIIASICALLLSLIVVAALVFFPVPQERALEGSLRDKYSFDEIVERSDYIVIAEYLSSKIDMHGELSFEFTIKDVLQGDAPEKAIHVYSSSNVLFQPGDDYLLVLVKYDTLFDVYPKFVLLGDTYIPVAEISVSTMYDEPIPVEKIESLLQKRNSVQLQSFDEEEKSYTDATDFPSIIQESDFIMEIKVLNMEVEGVYHNGNTYNCEVLNVQKGNLIDAYPNNGIMITLMKGSVTEGGTYIVMINQVDEHSLIYSQSSMKSVIPLSDTKTINEVKNIIAAATQ